MRRARLADSSSLAGGRLLDFPSSFPSLSHAWLFSVLRAMLVPADLLRIVEALYTDFTRTILFCGQEVAAFPIASGIRQG